MRQKVLDAFALDPFIRDVDVGLFRRRHRRRLPNWMDYTRLFQPVHSTSIPGGFGRRHALIHPLGGHQRRRHHYPDHYQHRHFHIPNTGGWQSYAWVPLRDANGNLVRLDLAGLATLRLTAGPGGGGNNKLF